MIMLIKERLNRILSEFGGKAPVTVQPVTDTEQENDNFGIMDYCGKYDIDGEKYLDALPDAPPITVAQFQKTLGCDVNVAIKPCNHKTYWHGKAEFIPKDLYDCTVNDIVLRKKGQDEVFPHGSLSLYVDKIEKYEQIADSEELREINHYYYTKSLKSDREVYEKKEIYKEAH